MSRHCLERVSNAAQGLTSHTHADLEGADGKALSPQGRLDSAAITLSALRPTEFGHVPGGRELFEAIMKRLTARKPGPDDSEDWGTIRATCSKLTNDECKTIAADILDLFWRVEMVEGPMGT